MEIDYDEPKVPKASTTVTASAPQQQTIMLTKQEPITTPETKTVIPGFIPAYNCPDGDCGQVHKNKNYSMRPKGKCENCSQFARSGEGKCPWCEEGKIEPIDEDELDNLGIPKPIPGEHEHI